MTNHRLLATVLLVAVLIISAYIALIVVTNTLDVQSLVVGLFWVSMTAACLTPLFDGFYLMYGVNSLRSLFRSKMYDLLRISTISPAAIIATRLHVARLYAWRMFFVIFCVRVILVVLWLLLACGRLIGTLASSNANIVETLIQSGFMTSAGISAAYFYIYEPYWRYQTVTAIGLRQAAQHRRMIGIVTWSALTIIGFWIFQIGAWLVGGYIIGIGSSIVFVPLINLLEGTDFIGAMPLMAVVAFLGGWSVLAFALLIRASQIDFVHSSVTTESERAWSNLR